MTDIPRPDPKSQASEGGSKALSKQGLRIDEYAMSASLRGRALVDAMDRTRGGAFVHLPLFVHMAGSRGSLRPTRRFFGTVLLQSRSWCEWYSHGTQRCRPIRFQSRTDTRIHVGVHRLYLLSGAPWAPWQPRCPIGPHSRCKIPILLVCTEWRRRAPSFSVLLRRSDRISAAVLLPPICASLLNPSESSLFAVAAAAMLWVYVIDAFPWHSPRLLGRCDRESRARTGGELERLSTTDALTQICNRRHFDEALR